VRPAAIGVLLFAVLYFADPPAHPAWSLCAFHWLTGLECPLCGLTRGMCAFAKGHWREALEWNALTPLAFAMLFTLFWNHPLRGRMWSAGIVMFAVYGVWRVLFRTA
jgi:hypothetical protein